MADDDEEDCLLACDAFAESGVKIAFSSVADGTELMDYLSEHFRSAAKRLPDLILLDMNMPRKDGRQALVEIKSEPAFQHIPIVILTSSEDQADVDFTMKAGAESFFTKPATFDEWVEIMRSLAKNWILR
jgi:CheY-like chemotaxis protein